MTNFKSDVKAMATRVLRFATGDYGIFAVVGILVLYMAI